MKKYFLLGMTIVALIGCTGPIQTSSNQETSVTTEEVTAATEKEFINEEKYRLVFEDLKRMQTTLVKNEKGLNIPLNSWTMEAIYNLSSRLYYTFYDINNDGTSELLISTISEEGEKYDFRVGYYLEGDQPKVFGQSFVASAGGARNFSTIQKNGDIYEVSFSSGTGDGIAEVKALTQNGTSLQSKVKVEFQKLQVPLEKLGIQEGNELDLNTLEWKGLSSLPIELSQKNVTSKMNLEELASGDFSSIAGTWKNGRGYTLIFDTNGLVSDDSKMTRYPHFEEGILKAGINLKEGGGHSIAFVPSGEELSPLDDGRGRAFTDLSKHDQDRIVGSQNAFVMASAEEYYYRVSE